MIGRNIGEFGGTPKFQEALNATAASENAKNIAMKKCKEPFCCELTHWTTDHVNAKAVKNL